MLLLFVLLVLVGTTAAQRLAKPYYDLNNAHNIFNNFIQKHGKIYDPEEYFQRFDIFKETLEEINERNAWHPQSVFEITSLADMTPEERRTRYGNKIPDGHIDKIATKLQLRPHEITAPEHWDWRAQGAVTHVKNQGTCGSCWIFSSTGAIEGQYAIKHNKTLAFSEQQGLDCLKFEANNCMGGPPNKVLAYHEKFGVVLEQDYPYTGKQLTCKEDPIKVITWVTSYKVYQPDEETLKQLVYEKGPLSVSIDPADFDFYKRGILYPHHCSHNLSHAVLLVGYGIENGIKYWILKDSAGPELRDHGYIKLVRGINACSMGIRYTATCTVA